MTRLFFPSTISPGHVSKLSLDLIVRCFSPVNVDRKLSFADVWLCSVRNFFRFRDSERDETACTAELFLWSESLSRLVNTRDGEPDIHEQRESV
jgi:hypothetical protein